MPEETNSAPFAGYKCSVFGPAAKAKLLAAEAKGCVKTEGGARKKLTESDIIFFGGHHYARYDLPLLFDSIDLNEFKLNSPKVKLLLISSCAGLRKNARDGFRRKFPNAYIFGWMFGSPLNQKGLMQKFIGSIDTRIDITRTEDMAKLIQRWRNFIESQVHDKSSVQPYGLGYATPQGEVSYYVRGKGMSWKWVTIGTNTK